MSAVSVAELEPHLDLAYWASAPPDRVFDLAPRAVLEDPGMHADHAARIDAAEVRWPIRLVDIGGFTMVLDGLHRLARAVRDGVVRVPVVWVGVEELGSG
ncbi:MAG: hypothetical protein R3F61_23195 [Myxococcota bacterium]